jgi:hypothetical protein
MNKSKTNKFFWCGWKVPRNIPIEHIAEVWPQDMEGWITGDTVDCMTWVGVVIANSSVNAWKKVLSCYGSSDTLIEQRWPPEEKPDNWQPSDRFPDFSLKLK